MKLNQLVKEIRVVLTTGVMLAPFSVQALPSGSEVLAGSVEVKQVNPTYMTINQNSDRAIVEWGSFDIGAKDYVKINQPNSNSAILNRVLSDNLTTIAGKLEANGQVFITNPNGVTFANGSIVNVGALTATTADIKNEDFMSGKLSFTKSGLRQGKVTIDAGAYIRIGEGGFSAFIAPHIQHNGYLEAKLGKVFLGAGEVFSLDVGGGLLNLVIEDKDLSKLLLSTGDKVDVDVAGTVIAQGGQIVLKADSVRDLVEGYITNQGNLIASDFVVNTDNTITLTTPGKLTVDAEYLGLGGTVISGKGGDIQISAKKDLEVSNTATERFVKAELISNALASGTNVKINGAADLILADAIDGRNANQDGGRLTLSANKIVIKEDVKTGNSASFESLGMLESLLGKTIYSSGDLQLKSHGDMVIDGKVVSAKGVDLQSTTGKIDIKGGVLSEEANVVLVAKQNITQSLCETADSVCHTDKQLRAAKGEIQLTSQEGDIDLGNIVAKKGIVAMTEKGSIYFNKAIGGKNTGYIDPKIGYESDKAPDTGYLHAKAKKDIYVNGLNLDGRVDGEAGLKLEAGNFIISNEKIAVNKGDIILGDEAQLGAYIFLGDGVFSRGLHKAVTALGADDHKFYNIVINNNLVLFDNTAEYASVDNKEFAKIVIANNTENYSSELYALPVSFKGLPNSEIIFAENILLRGLSKKSAIDKSYNINLSDLTFTNLVDVSVLGQAQKGLMLKLITPLDRSNLESVFGISSYSSEYSRKEECVYSAITCALDYADQTFFDGTVTETYNRYSFDEKTYLDTTTIRYVDAVLPEFLLSAKYFGTNISYKDTGGLDVSGNPIIDINSEQEDYVYSFSSAANGGKAITDFSSIGSLSLNLGQTTNLNFANSTQQLPNDTNRFDTSVVTSDNGNNTGGNTGGVLDNVQSGSSSEQIIALEKANQQQTLELKKLLALIEGMVVGKSVTSEADYGKLNPLHGAAKDSFGQAYALFVPEGSELMFIDYINKQILPLKKKAK